MDFAKPLFAHLVEAPQTSGPRESWWIHAIGSFVVRTEWATVFDPTSGEADGLEVPPGSHRVYAVMDAAPGAAPMAVGLLLWFGETPPVELGEYSGVGVLTHCGVVCLSGSSDDDGALVDALMRLAGLEIRHRAANGQDRGLLPLFDAACRQHRPDALRLPEESAPDAFRAGWHVLSDERTQAMVVALLDNGEGGGIYPCLDAHGREVAHLVQFETE
ncbi:hypothetical protein AB0K51_13075 [Kitasatospora sp. NPDC049285]|uniref:hypothetical protein n=1 Tax=Kitasatospora sp. NPDC049285 TaxID=3157096 RepID=UPI003413E654